MNSLFKLYEKLKIKGYSTIEILGSDQFRYFEYEDRLYPNFTFN